MKCEFKLIKKFFTERNILQILMGDLDIWLTGILISIIIIIANESLTPDTDSVCIFVLLSYTAYIYYLLNKECKEIRHGT